MNMKVNIAGVEWKNPVTVASGTFGSGAEFADYVDLNRLGAVTTKGVANVPWEGNPTPRVAETYGGMMNAVGLQNPGIDVFCERDIPFLRKYDTKIIVNVCGRSEEDYCEVVERLAGEDVDMLEINISCPNVKEGGIAFGQNPKAAEDITRAVKKYAKQPVIMKLSPNVTSIAEMARAVEAGGADAVSLINTITGMKIDINRKAFVLANKTGGVNPDDYDVKLSGVIDNRDKFVHAKRIIFVACGTSWHASLIGEHLIENICRIPVEVEYASEFRYRNPIIHPEDIVIAVSQSGETADTLAAVELARKAGAFVFGICNVVGSSIARATDSGAYIHVGPEIGVASTKAFTGQVTVMAMLALTIGKERGTVSDSYFREVSKGLLELPDTLTEVLKLDKQISDLSKIFTYAHNFIYLGRGYNYPTALEGALKLKEISYIHAEGYPAAEMKHGPIALIDNEMPTVAIATPDHTYAKTLSNIEEVKARGGRIIAVIAKDDEQARRCADYCIEVPVVTECLMPIVVSVPLQLLAYYIAVYKGRNVDQPRNLAKSVTVE